MLTMQATLMLRTVPDHSHIVENWSIQIQLFRNNFEIRIRQGPFID